MNQDSICMMVGHLAPLASAGMLTTTGEMTGLVSLEHGGRAWQLKLGVQFETLKRPTAMPDAMRYATQRLATRLQEWLNTGSYTEDAYTTFAAELVGELDECFGPRYGAVFRGIALYGQDTLPLLVGASGLWQAGSQRSAPGWWWE